MIRSSLLIGLLFSASQWVSAQPPLHGQHHHPHPFQTPEVLTPSASAIVPGDEIDSADVGGFAGLEDATFEPVTADAWSSAAAGAAWPRTLLRPEIVGMSSRRVFPVPFEAGAPPTIDSPVAVIRVSGLAPGSRVAPLLDGRPLPGQTLDCCGCFTLRLRRELAPGTHTLAVRAIPCTHGSVEPGEISEAVTFRYSPAQDYGWMQTPAPVAPCGAPAMLMPIGPGIDNLPAKAPPAPEIRPSLELDPPPAFPDQAESASTASHATSTSAQSAVEQVADSAKPLESVPVATVVLPACPCPDGAGFPFRYEFLSPAHFAWRGFGQREDLVEREGIIIYEGMRLEWNESGRYRLTFFTNWAEVPATLRLQLLVRQCERGAVHTITIPAITLDADRRNRRLALVPDGMAQDEFRGASLDATFQTPDQDRGRRTALPSFRISGTGTLDGSRSTQDQALWNLNGRIEPEDRPSHTSDKDERSHLQRQVVEGYSPAIEQACGRLAEIRRSGTARFGYSSVHASQVAASPR